MGPTALTWATGLLDICLGAARGLAHLHAHGIMHRDVSVAAWRVPVPRVAGTCMAQRVPALLAAWAVLEDQPDLMLCDLKVAEGLAVMMGLQSTSNVEGRAGQRLD